MSNFFKKSTVILLLFAFLTAQLTFYTTAQDIGDDNYTYQLSESSAKEDVENNTAIENNKKIKLNYVYLIEEKVEDLIPFYQNDYGNIKYGNYGTIASHGCGITCLSMISSYFTDIIHTPPELAKKYGDYNTEEGSLWVLFEDSAKDMDLPLQERTTNTNKVIKALKNGQYVVALESENIFTATGHFIILKGITKDGKILVQDPYRDNYTKSDIMIEGYENGFTKKQVFTGGGPYWIYKNKK